MVAGEDLAGAAQPCLDLVGDEQDILGGADVFGRPEIPCGRDEDPGFRLDGLDEEGSGVGCDGLLQGLDIPKRDDHEPGGKRTEIVAVERFSGKADDRYGPAMEIIGAGDDFCSILGNSLFLIGPLAGGFDGRIAAQEVEVLLTLDVPGPDPLALGQDGVQRVIVVGCIDVFDLDEIPSVHFSSLKNKILGSSPDERSIWRRGWDSNPRYALRRTHAFQACSFSHSDTSPRGNRLSQKAGNRQVSRKGRSGQLAGEGFSDSTTCSREGSKRWKSETLGLTGFAGRHDFHAGSVWG